MSAGTRTRPPREIETDLERNRARMNDSLDWLEYKLSPGELFNQAWSYARDKGNGELASNLRDTIARNPLPIALVGLGLAWLAISGRRGSAYTGDAYEEDWDTTMPADSPADARVHARDATPDDEVAPSLDEVRPTSDKPGPAVYGSSSASRSTGAVAENLDAAGPTSKESEPGLQGGRSSPSGHAHDVTEDPDKTRVADHRGTHVTLGTRNGPKNKSLHRRT